MNNLKNYYDILGISFPSNEADIKAAYRKQSLKWHPDRNPNVDVTQKMQDINEAYAILKDSEKKARYDHEYVLFKQFKKKEERKKGFEQTSYNQKTHENYSVHDEDLKNDIRAARQYAQDLVEEFMKSLKKEAEVAAKGVWDGAQGYVYAGIILTIIGLLIRACQ